MSNAVGDGEGLLPLDRTERTKDTRGMTELMTIGGGLLPHTPPVDAPARLPVSRTAQIMLDMIGLDVVCTMIING